MMAWGFSNLTMTILWVALSAPTPTVRDFVVGGLVLLSWVLEATAEITISFTKDKR